MSRTILVPLDGSPFAEHALPAALAIARRTGAALELVIVDRAPVPWISPELLIAFDQNHVGVDGRQYLEELHARMPADVPVRLTRLFGTPTPLLVRRILKTEPALVVMSTHGRGGFSRVWLGSARRGVSRFEMGSVADKVLRTAPCPVMLFHPTHEVVDVRRRVEAAIEATVPL